MQPQPSQILADSSMYGALTDEVRERLATIAQGVKLVQGRALFRVGDECPAVYVMHSGVVRLSQTAPTGKAHVLRFAEAGESFAEAAVIGGFRCPIDADVLEGGFAVRIPADPLREYLEQDHELCLGFLRVMSLRNRGIVGRASDIALRDATGRLAHFLLERVETESTAASGGRSETGAQATDEPEAAIQLMVSKRELAQHLNLTSETLSRVFRRLVDAGTIENDLHHEVRITNRGHLQDLAWEKPAH